MNVEEKKNLRKDPKEAQAWGWLWLELSSMAKHHTCIRICDRNIGETKELFSAHASGIKEVTSTVHAYGMCTQHMSIISKSTYRTSFSK